MTDAADDFVRDILEVCRRHEMKIMPSLPPTHALELVSTRARHEMEDALRVALYNYKAKR